MFEPLVSQFQSSSLMELTAVLFALAYLTLVVKENILCWYAALISTIIFLLAFPNFIIYNEIPILTVAACFCNGVSEIKDAQELRVKETDRLKVMARQLQKFGAEITEKEDGLIINGQSKFHSAEVDSETDHRVAMSLAIASLLAKGTSKIMRAEAASVSYPTFWEELAKLTN